MIQPSPNTSNKRPSLSRFRAKSLGNIALAENSLFEAIALNSTRSSKDVVLRMKLKPGSEPVTVAVFKGLTEFRTNALVEAIAQKGIDECFQVIHEIAQFSFDSSRPIASHLGAKPDMLISAMTDAYYNSLTLKELKPAYQLSEPIKDLYMVAVEPFLLLQSTFLRFQEYFESPYFRGKVFSHSEYVKWNQTQNKNGDFSYYFDWGGFNLPSFIIEDVRADEFGPFSKPERAFLSIIKPRPERFYVIGVDSVNNEADISHEIAHGLYYIFSDYRREVDKVISSIDTSALEKYLIEKGYAPHVIPDECNAYILDGYEYLAEEGIRGRQYKSAYKTLKRLFDAVRQEAENNTI